MAGTSSVYSVDTALNNYLEAISDTHLEYEIINIEDAVSRILYEDINVKVDHPPFDRALIDGYALKADDVGYASEKNPAILELLGEINVGGKEKTKILKNQTYKISKGAFLPENADAVVPPDDVKPETASIKVIKGAVPDSNVTKRGEDLKAEEVFIRKNRKLRPQDIGGIIGIGYRQVKVFKKPVITIIPVGSELVALDVEPDYHEIIASNGYVLKGFVDQMGGIGRISAIVNDELNQVKGAISKALEVSDMVMVSGGSSTGSKDYTFKAIESLENSQVIADEISMRPGGHVLLAIVGNKPVIGLPGHPVSNMTCFNVFGKPVLRKLTGTPRSFWQERKDTIKLDAFLAKKISSPEGKEDYVRVRLQEEEDKILAYPYTGKSSFLSTLVRSHGVIKICAECTGLYEGDRVEVMLL